MESICVNVRNLEDVKAAVRIASAAPCLVEVLDNNNHIADCSSILGMLALNYKSPVTIRCERGDILKRLTEVLDG